jgi:hypothetical protein
VPAGEPAGSVQTSGSAALQVNAPALLTDPNVRPAPRVSVRVSTSRVAELATVAVSV